jgi:hypothetical protein
MIADELNINECMVHQIDKQDLNMRNVCAKMVPKNLNEDQKVHRKEVSAEMLEWLETEPHFLNWVITGDESWFFEYGPETKRQSEEWHMPQSPRQKKARMSKSEIKAMVIIFFDSHTAVHKEFVPPGVTANQKYFLKSWTV